MKQVVRYGAYPFVLALGIALHYLLLENKSGVFFCYVPAGYRRRGYGHGVGMEISLQASVVGRQTGDCARCHLHGAHSRGASQTPGRYGGVHFLAGSSDASSDR